MAYFSICATNILNSQTKCANHSMCKANTTVRDMSLRRMVDPSK